MFSGPRFSELVDPGAKFRAEHSAWLTHALRTRARYPRIPAKRADHGGFERLMSLPTGPSHADRWWRVALSRIGLGGGR